ncbi:hypothetical protein SGRA_0079 [Saprospira grandis str. Lewin]|uniref:Uncharacterized protein n=1 Tax=Saprospira grandis (strain Lewin) TaxID=984262 RepID=H6L4E5_SAPGL|nr:hypothetical protein SGRA_0079 [Saprospira grandis str. Lewin]
MPIGPNGPALRSRGPKGQTQAAKGGCRAEQTCERRSIAAADLAEG